MHTGEYSAKNLDIIQVVKSKKTEYVYLFYNMV
jgi:hypothetical protein